MRRSPVKDRLAISDRQHTPMALEGLTDGRRLAAAGGETPPLRARIARSGCKATLEEVFKAEKCELGLLNWRHTPQFAAVKKHHRTIGKFAHPIGPDPVDIRQHFEVACCSHDTSPRPLSSFVDAFLHWRQSLAFSGRAWTAPRPSLTEYSPSLLEA